MHLINSAMAILKQMVEVRFLYKVESNTIRIGEDFDERSRSIFYWVQ